jgi:hypothetical protein
MNRTLPAAAAVVMALGVFVGSASAGNVNISIGAPAIVTPPVIAEPPVVVEPQIVVTAPPLVVAPPSVVIVPGTSVYHVPSAGYNIFVYRDRYYSFHNSAWFVAFGPGKPWRMVAFEHVPYAVRNVPDRYYRVPPHHGKHEKFEHEREHEGGHGCPPGLAKQGRC